MVLLVLLYSFIFAGPVKEIFIPIIFAGLLNLDNDLTFKPKLSFIKISFLFIIFAFAAYFTNPLTIFGCILIFSIVFLTTFTSYKLFGVSVYIPYLLIYFILISNHLKMEDLPITIFSLLIGAIFIVSLNLLINYKNSYKLSVENIDYLFNELYDGIDLKLEGKPVSREVFKYIHSFYANFYNNFEYKYFPNPNQQVVLNIVKSLQNIGTLLLMYDFTSTELKYIKKTLSNIENTNSNEIFYGINFKTKEMSIVLLNLEILSYGLCRDLNNTSIIPNRKMILNFIITHLEEIFHYMSDKFIFAFKMALILFVLEVFTLVFNFPYTKWLIFVSISSMVPYIEDIKYTAKYRIEGTIIGSLFIVLVIVFFTYIPADKNMVITAISIICIIVMTFSLNNQMEIFCVLTIVSILSASLFIPLPNAILLKILWVAIGLIIVSAFNFLFLPFSVEKESKHNLKYYSDLNGKSIDLIKNKVLNIESYFDKTTVLILSNNLQENIEFSDENEKLLNIQNMITDISNIILNYLDIYTPSDSLKNNIVNIIDNKTSEVDESLPIKDQVILNCLNHLMQLYKEESILIKKLKLV